MGYPYKFTVLLAAASIAIAPLAAKAANTAEASPAAVERSLGERVAQADRDDLSDEQKERLSNLIGEAQKKIDSSDYGGAIALYQQALQVDRDNARIYSGIAYLQGRQGNFTAAAEYYRQALDRRSAQSALSLRPGSQPIYG